MPPEQLCPALQALSQVPQWFTSVVTSMQAPPHDVWPAGHVHAPALQDCPAAQALPHMPQFNASV